MFKAYIITKPVVLRSEPDSESVIMNALPAGSIVKIVSEANGWYQTDSGRYIFGQERLESVSDYNKRMMKEGTPERRVAIPTNNSQYSNYANYFNETVEQRKARAAVATYTRISPRAETGLPEPGDMAVIDANSTTIDGSSIDPSLTIRDGVDAQHAAQWVISEVNLDEGYSTLKYVGENGNVQTIHVSLDSIQYSRSGDKFQDVSEKAMQEAEHENYMNEVISNIVDVAGNVANYILSDTQLTVNNMRSVFGIPYQFSSIVDNRIDGSFNDDQFGRVFNEKIIGRAPLMIIQPGVPEFMQGFNDDDKSKIIDAMGGMLAGKPTDLDKLLNQAGKYYSLKIDKEAYFKCVTPMCRAMAAFLGIQDREYRVGSYSDKLRKFNWMKANTAALGQYGYLNGAMAFYINSSAQVNESFSNGTSQSQLASKVNQIGQLGQEIQFLMGGASNVFGFNNPFSTENINRDLESDSSLVGSLIDNAATLMAGGRMIFPEIWSDSQHMAAYQVNIKLDSPDSDNYSIYLNILVPLAHILGLIMPRKVGSNTYISPFLVRAYYKSMFHIDMGIITQCDITKGESGCWTQNGLPTQINIQLTIKDLYNVLSMSQDKGDNDLFGSPAQLDYLANLCGFNLSLMGIGRMFTLWKILRAENGLSDLLTNMWSNTMSGIYRRLYNLFNNDWKM